MRQTVAGVAAALSWLHSCGVVHGDVTAQNVYLAQPGEYSSVVLGDYAYSSAIQALGESCEHVR